MAESGGGSEELLRNNSIFNVLHGAVRKIVGGIFSKPKSDVIEELVTDIDEDLIVRSRENVFMELKVYYQQQVEAAGVSGKVNLELKSRRGNPEERAVAEARDLVDMILYLSKCTNKFPKDILQSKSTYFEVEIKDGGRSTDDNSNLHVKKPSSTEERFNTLSSTCEKLEKAMVKIWEYIFNIEKIHMEELVTLRNDVNAILGGNELKSDTGIKANSLTLAKTLDSKHVSNPIMQPQTCTQSTMGIHNTGPGANVRESRDRVDARSRNDHDRDLSPGQRDKGSRSREDPISTSEKKPGDQLNPSLCNGLPVANHRDVDVVADDSEDDKLSYAGVAGASPTLSQIMASQNTHGDISRSKPNDSNRVVPDKIKSSLKSNQHVVNKNGDIRQHAVNTSDSKIGPARDKDALDGWQKPRYARKPNRGNNPGNNNQGAGNTNRSDTNSNNANKVKSVDFTLSGIRKESSVDVYVQNIRRKRSDTLKELADKVRMYCQSKGVRVMYARIIGNKYYEDCVGCKLTIPLRQYDDVIGTRMWPDDVICRKWENKNQNSGANSDRRPRSRTRNSDGRAPSAAPHSRSRSRPPGAAHHRSRSRDADHSRSRAPVRRESRSPSPNARSRSRYRAEQTRYGAVNYRHHDDNQRRHDGDYWWHNQDRDNDNSYDSAPEELKWDASDYRGTEREY